MAGLLDLDRRTSLGLLMAGAQMMNTPRQDGAFGAIGNGLLGFAQGLLDQEKLDRERAREDKKDARQSKLDDVEMELKRAQAQHYLMSGSKEADPYFTPIPTANGVYGFDNRSGKVMLAIDENGKPVIKSSDSPELQGTIAASRKRGETANSLVELDNADGSKTKTLGGTAFPELTRPNQPLPQRPTDLSKLPQKVLQDGQYHDLADYIGAAQQFVPNIIQVESGGNPNAVSPVGAKGLMQIMDKTGATPGMNVIPLQNKSNSENVRFGTDYFAALLKENNGDVARALSAYNQGQGNLNQKGVTNPDYVNNVFNAKPSQDVINFSNPLIKPTVGGMILAAKSGIEPTAVTKEGVNIAKENLQNAQRIDAATNKMYKGQSQKDKLDNETAAAVEKQKQLDALKIQTEPKITAANEAAKNEATANSVYRSANESGALMKKRLENIMPYLYPDGKPIFNENGDLVPPQQKMIFDNSPMDKARFLAHNKGFGKFKEAENLNSLIKASNEMVTDALGGKLGTGISNVDVDFMRDTFGIDPNNLKSMNDIYRSVGQWYKKANELEGRGKKPQAQQVHVDDLVGKYIKMQ